MSLLNDALKKAQSMQERQRVSGFPAPGPNPSSSATADAVAQKSPSPVQPEEADSRSSKKLMGIAAAAVLLVGGGAGAYFVFSGNEQPAPQVASNPTTAPQPAAPASSQATPVEAAPATPEPAAETQTPSEKEAKPAEPAAVAAEAAPVEASTSVAAREPEAIATPSPASEPLPAEEPAVIAEATPAQESLPAETAPAVEPPPAVGAAAETTPVAAYDPAPADHGEAMPATPVLPDLADSFISEQPDPTEATAVHAEDIDAPITAGDPLFHGTPAPALASQTAPAESVTTVEPAAPVEDSADEVRHVYSPAAAPERIASGNGVIIETVPTNEGSLISASGNNPDPAIEGWVAQIKLSGVRLGATPKVLMNDRVFQIGDVVDRRTGLVLSAIENRELQFRDPAGNTYVLRF